MKFEIDDNTGLITSQIFTEGYKVTGGQDILSRDLSQILQAGKKTKEKLEKKEIQDSKNTINFTVKDATFTVEDSLGNVKTFDKRHIQHIEIVDDSRNHYQDLPLAKIEQNQEIVDVVKQWAQSEPISNGIKLTHEQLKIRRGSVYRLINLIRDKTGIDIGESS